MRTYGRKRDERGEMEERKTSQRNEQKMRGNGRNRIEKSRSRKVTEERKGTNANERNGMT
jgi:hypothetical protein